MLKRKSNNNQIKKNNFISLCKKAIIVQINVQQKTKNEHQTKL